MKIWRATLEGCGGAGGLVVVIDVLRAFTTTAYAFAAGAKEFVLVSTVDEAFRLRERLPRHLLIGEVGGLPVPGFDLPNSPSAMARFNLEGRSLILRTSAGTQGVTRAVHAEKVLAASLCCAAPTAQYIGMQAAPAVTLIETGVGRSGTGGEEDTACGDYLSALLTDRPVNHRLLKQKVEASRAAAKFRDPEELRFPSEDLDCALQIDRFGFAMEVRREDGLPVLRSVSL